MLLVVAGRPNELVSVMLVHCGVFWMVIKLYVKVWSRVFQGNWIGFSSVSSLLTMCLDDLSIQLSIEQYCPNVIETLIKALLHEQYLLSVRKTKYHLSTCLQQKEVAVQRLVVIMS